MRQFLVKPARPRRNIQCIAFLATAGLVSAMLAQGIRVRTNILSPHEYVAPFEDISVPKLHELLQDSRFKFIATVTFLTTPTGSNQTFNVPANWNNGNNKAETIGAGGSGAVINGNSPPFAATGGAGGGYSAQPNITLTPGGTATWQTGNAGAALVSGSGGVTNFSNGNNGGDTWFNGTTLGGSSVGAKGGGGGGTTFSTNSTGGAAGGAAGSGVGTTKNSGGNSGSATPTSGVSASGGGGAAGLNGNGVASGNAGNNTATAGGNGDNSSGGAGSAGVGSGTSSAGGVGTEYDGSHGSGGGSGAGASTSAAVASGNAGNFGAGSGGAVGNGVGCATGSASGGLIVVTNTPATRGFFAGIIG